MAIKVEDFLVASLLGNKFMAVKSYSQVLDRETKKISAYRLNISIQDPESPFFMEMISVKIKNLTPSVSVESLKGNKVMAVELKNLTLGQFNGNLWFSCDDVCSNKISLNK